jgi:glycosyltransferase involved in cell wall biosynthesis
MKIVFITPNYPPTICGVGDHTFHLAQHFLDAGNEVHIICLAKTKAVKTSRENIYPIVKQSNIECHEIPNILGTEAVSIATKIIRAIQPNWVIVQYEPYGFQLKGLPFMMLFLYQKIKAMNIPVLTIFHEIRIRPERDIRTKIVSFLQTKIANRLAKMSEKVVTSIDFYAHILHGWRSKLTIIPIGSNILPIKISDFDKQALKQKYGIGEDTFVICTFGNRDFSDHLAAFDKLEKDYPNLVWLIAGKTKTPSVFLASRSYIRYVGEMSAPDIYRHLSLGNVFFMPDEINEKGQGGTSNKSGSLACACALGIPIVATKGDLNNQLLIDNDNILLVDISDTEQLYRAFKTCLVDENQRLVLGKNAQKLYHQSLKWENQAHVFLNIMTQ